MNGAAPPLPLRYAGRFAPSPTGPLHAGSLVAALASWLDARAFALRHPGAEVRWLVRIEDVDRPRSVPGCAQFILQQLARCGLVSDGPVLRQSERDAFYQKALDQLAAQARAYPCACSRKDIGLALSAAGTARQRTGELRYPGTCRAGLRGRSARAWRFAIPLAPHEHRVSWHDRWMGAQTQDVATAVGDFVLRRADGCYAYQLAVVLDDAAQNITHVVRGADLADNTPRQILLQRALGLPTPQYLHTPLVLGANGEKLSKQNGATALNLDEPLWALNAAAQCLHLPPAADTVATALQAWVQAWASRFFVQG